MPTAETGHMVQSADRIVSAIRAARILYQLSTTVFYRAGRTVYLPE